MPWNDERLRELHFPCAFFEHQGSVLTLACSNPGPSPTCPGQNCLWGGGSQTHAPTPLISVPCSTLVRELSPDTSSLLSRHIQRLSSAVFVMSQNPRDCAEPAKNVGSAAAPAPASLPLSISRSGWAGQQPLTAVPTSVVPATWKTDRRPYTGLPVQHLPRRPRPTVGQVRRAIQ